MRERRDGMNIFEIVWIWHFLYQDPVEATEERTGVHML